MTDTASSATDIDARAWANRIRQDAFARYHLEMGVAILREGNIPAAEAAFRRAIDADSSLSRSYFYLERLLEEAGRHDEARTVHARGLAVDPGFVQKALVRMALIRLNDDGPEEALAVLDGNAAVLAGMAEAQVLLAVIQAGRTDGDAAWDTLTDPSLLRRALGSEADPELAAGISERFFPLVMGPKAGPKERLVRLLRAALAVDSNDAMFLEQLGIMLANAELFAEAEPLLNRALVLWPGAPRALQYLGFAYLGLGRAADAEPVLRQALESDPDNPWLLGMLGQSLNGLGRSVEAESVLRQALQNNPPDPSWLLVTLGLSLLVQGRVAEAESLLQRAIQLNTTDPWAFVYLGAARRSLGHIAEAEMPFRQASAALPGNASLRMFLGLVLLELGKTKEAIPLIDQALVDGGENPILLNQYGMVLMIQGRLADAIAALRRSDGPDIPPWLRSNLAMALLADGQAEEAEEIMREVVAIAPGNPVLLARYGTVLVARNRPAQAEPLLREAVDKLPGANWVAEQLARALVALDRKPEARAVLTLAASQYPLTAEQRAVLESLGG